MNAALKLEPESARDAVQRLFAGDLHNGYRLAGLHRWNDAEGRELFRVVRLKNEAGDKIIRPMHHDGDRYRLGKPERPAAGWPIYSPPYPLVATDPIYLVEGEGCADAAARLGLTAVTSGSASSADAADWAPLAGKVVHIWPDADKPGHAYADTCAARLRTLGCAVGIIDVTTLNLPDGGDVVDWLAAHPGATGDDVRALSLVESPEDARQRIIDDALAKAAEDAGALFEPEILAAIREQREASPADYQRLRVKPKGAAEPSEVRAVVAVTLRDLLTRDLPPREMLLSPWLQSQSLSMIHAWRGVGKTHVALGIAYALACGGKFLDWQAPTPVRVLYLDGEMPGAALKDRCAAIVAAADAEAPEDFLRFVTPDLQPDGVMPDLATREGQESIEVLLGDSRVIVVDNISCLVRSGGKENDADSWAGVAQWALRMRASGRSVVFIHHSGKSGLQRGTSKREDLLDTVILLRRPSDYEPSQGARFEVNFEKARALFGKDVSPFEATLETDAHGRQIWKTTDASNNLRDRAIELHEIGLSQADIAGELGCARSTIMRNLREAERDGKTTRPVVKRKLATVTPIKAKRREPPDD